MDRPLCQVTPQKHSSGPRLHPAYPLLIGLFLVLVYSLVSTYERRPSMSSLQPQSQVISLEQYEALPEDVRAEVFDGQLYYMASPSQEHQTISIELLTYLSG